MKIAKIIAIFAGLATAICGYAAIWVNETTDLSAKLGITAFVSIFIAFLAAIFAAEI